MCGIAGIVRFDGEAVELGRLEAMRDHLRHRGPDGDGVNVYGNCGLAHTRLAVLDPEGGHQPMAWSEGNCDGAATVAVVFNGEIYNHHELRRKLEARGHRFRSDHCDTEVILRGYIEFGDMLARQLHGMYAFAIWDGRSRTLHLGRDRVGQKPLFFRLRPGPNGQPRKLVFASLPAAILKGMDPDDAFKPSRLALLQYLRFGYTEQRCLIDDIVEVPAASWMTVDHNGRAKVNSYWQPPPVSRSSTSIGVTQAATEVLTEAVATRLEADVPVGCFLSGGVDSSLVAAMAQRTLQQRGGDQLRTFSVAMPSLQYDETEFAQMAAAHIGSNHTVLQADIESRNVMADLEHLMAVTGEPTADSSLLPTYWLSQATREHVTVALSGDGGDELFGGYDRYRAMRALSRFGKLVRPIPIGLFSGSEQRSTGHRAQRFVKAARGQSPQDQYFGIVQLLPDELIESLGAMPQRITPPLSDWPDESNSVQAAMRWDLLHYLPFDVLRKVDRASMAVALEVRCPMLDTQVCDLATHLPVSVLMPGGRAKALLREIAAPLLPKTIVRRQKRGFGLPIGHWFRNELYNPLRERLLDGGLSSLGFNREPIEQLLTSHKDEQDDHTHRLFGLLQLALWCDWLEAQRPR